MLEILIVEDNGDLLDDMALNLTHSGFRVVCAQNAQQMDALLINCTPDVVLLDLGLPGEDGLSIAQRLKDRYPSMGIIMVTARGGLENRILGHQLGADHYLCKPVNYQELMVVIQNLGRRLKTHQVTETNVFNGWVVDKQKMCIYAPNCPEKGELLTWAEFNILEVFMMADNEVASKEDLIRGLGGAPEYFDHRRLETAMSRLRRKLSAMNPDVHSSQELIRALRNRGYQFTQPLKMV